MSIYQPDQYEVVRGSAAMWARALLRQVERYRVAHELAESRSKAFDHADDWTTWAWVVEGFDDEWAEAHMLVVAAHKLDSWVRRWALEADDDRPVPVEDALINDLRDALEHLDEAVFDEDTGGWLRDPSSSKRKIWALERLPRTPGGSGTTASGDVIALGLVSINRLERTAVDIEAQITDEIEAPEIDTYIQSEIDRRLGK